jgi:hypothetical protein
MCSNGYAGGKEAYPDWIIGRLQRIVTLSALKGVVPQWYHRKKRTLTRRELSGRRWPSCLISERRSASLVPVK